MSISSIKTFLNKPFSTDGRHGGILEILKKTQRRKGDDNTENITDNFLMNICLVCCICIFSVSVGILLLNFLKCQLRIPFLGRTLVSLTTPLLLIHFGFNFSTWILMLWVFLGINLVYIQSLNYWVKRKTCVLTRLWDTPTPPERKLAPAYTHSPRVQT